MPRATPNFNLLPSLGEMRLISWAFGVQSEYQLPLCSFQIFFTVS